MNDKCRDVNILNTPVKPLQHCGLWTTVQGILVRCAAAVSGTMRVTEQLSTPPFTQVKHNISRRILHSGISVYCCCRFFAPVRALHVAGCFCCIGFPPMPTTQFHERGLALQAS